MSPAMPGHAPAPPYAAAGAYPRSSPHSADASYVAASSAAAAGGADDGDPLNALVARSRARKTGALASAVYPAASQSALPQQQQQQQPQAAFSPPSHSAYRSAPYAYGGGYPVTGAAFSSQPPYGAMAYPQPYAAPPDRPTQPSQQRAATADAANVDGAGAGAGPSQSGPPPISAFVQQPPFVPSGAQQPRRPPAMTPPAYAYFGQQQPHQPQQQQQPQPYAVHFAYPPATFQSPGTMFPGSEYAAPGYAPLQSSQQPPFALHQQQQQPQPQHTQRR